MTKQKKIPKRLCTGCKEQKEKRELVRIVKSPEGEISLDLTSKKPGRGAYICPSAQCLQKAKKSRALERVFQCRIPDEVWADLEEAFKQYDAE